MYFPLPLSLSSKLRAALGLSDKSHTPPLYILRMRELGYPPGWRQIQEEYLKMFDEPGQGKRADLANFILLSLQSTQYMQYSNDH